MSSALWTLLGILSMVLDCSHYKVKTQKYYLLLIRTSLMYRSALILLHYLVI